MRAVPLEAWPLAAILGNTAFVVLLWPAEDFSTVVGRKINARAVDWLARATQWHHSLS